MVFVGLRNAAASVGIQVAARCFGPGLVTNADVAGRFEPDVAAHSGNQSVIRQCKVATGAQGDIGRARAAEAGKRQVAVGHGEVKVARHKTVLELVAQGQRAAGISDAQGAGLGGRVDEAVARRAVRGGNAETAAHVGRRGACHVQRAAARTNAAVGNNGHREPVEVVACGLPDIAVCGRHIHRLAGACHSLGTRTTGCTTQGVDTTGNGHIAACTADTGRADCHAASRTAAGTAAKAVATATIATRSVDTAIDQDTLARRRCRRCDGHIAGRCTVVRRIATAGIAALGLHRTVNLDKTRRTDGDVARRLQGAASVAIAKSVSGIAAQGTRADI